jgi:hypothetical protein
LDTGRKLSLGFGALLLILVVTALVVMGRIGRLEQHLREVTAFAEPASAAAYEWKSAWRNRQASFVISTRRRRSCAADGGWGANSTSRGRHEAWPGLGEEETGARISRCSRLRRRRIGADGWGNRRRRLAVDLGHGFSVPATRVRELRSGITGKGRARASNSGRHEALSDLAGRQLAGHYTHATPLSDPDVGGNRLGAELTRFGRSLDASGGCWRSGA